MKQPSILFPSEELFAPAPFLHSPAASAPPPNGNGLLRVAAYIRVSTDSRRQEDSYQRQEEHFVRLFASHPEWESAGIYSDYGLSATSQQKRVGFRRLLRHCREGRVQRIFCKSISRFARNTQDFMDALSALKEGGATIYFETERLDTAYYTNEFVLTTLAALAQEESRSLSENVRWGIQKRYQTGEVTNLPIYGYRYAQGGRESPLAEVEVVETQARVVRWIFEQAAAGRSFRSIAGALNQAKVEPPQTIWCREHKRRREGTPPGLGERRDEIAVGWTGEQISRLLQTERYTGDLLLQKKYTAGFLPCRLKINRGELPKYWVENHHPPIVSRQLFDQVQRRFSSTRTPPRSRFHAFSRRLVCASCGRYYTVRHRRGKPVWYCPTSALPNGVFSCGGEEMEEELLFSLFFQGVLLRYLFPPEISLSRFQQQLKTPWDCVQRVRPRLLRSLEQLEQGDSVELQRSLLKKQIYALKLSLERLGQNPGTALTSRRRQLWEEKRQIQSVLENKEAYWERLEQGYAQRKELENFCRRPPEGGSLQDWLKPLVQPLVLSIHLFSGLRFWFHWFDDTFTRLTLSGEGTLLSFDHRRPAQEGLVLGEGAWVG